MSNSKKVEQAYNILKLIIDGEKKSYAEVKQLTHDSLSSIPLFKNETDDFYEQVINKYCENMYIKAYEPIYLTKNKNKEKTWFKTIEKSDKTEEEYFYRYKQYLRARDFAEDTIRQVDIDTRKTLSLCADPNNINDYTNRKKRGLVVGDVQSGKTSNYLALINLACDYGYKLIVVLAGMTNSLRTQTQIRIDKGFVGYISESRTKNEFVFVGVGKNGKKYFAVPLTNGKKDFVKEVAESNNYTITDSNKPVILVIKKNKSVLDAVKDWVKPGQKGISGNSILIIDDEADNASINTKKDPGQHTAINNGIRALFNNFEIASYVGYTATPFANIFINSDYDSEEDMDLFPSDFIIQLRAPDNYFGASKVFNSYRDKKNNFDNLDNKRAIRLLDPDEENFIPVDHKKDYVITDLPISLKEAILSFLLNCCIRTINGSPTEHRSMMINVTRFNDIQLLIKEKVTKYVAEIKNIINQTSLFSLERFRNEEEMNRLYLIYNSNFYQNYEENGLDRLPSWEKIQTTLYEEINKFEVAIFNNKIKYDDRFDYEKYTEVGARVIAIGGFVLSRGLTLEGLMISYFNRKTSAYDSALQMCRWFGYRKKYENLCRIYISQENVDNFGAVIDSVENLKKQFADMALKDKTPRDYGLMVQESPDTLETKILVTARNKQYFSKEVEIYLNYGGVAADTSKLFKSFDHNSNNLNSFKRFICDLKMKGILLSTINRQLMLRNVESEDVCVFLEKLSIPFENRKFDVDTLVPYIKGNKELKIWDVLIAQGSNKELEWKFEGERITPTQRSFVNNKDEDIIRISGNNNRLVNPGNFSAGMSMTEIESAKMLARVRRENDSNKIKTDTPIADDYLTVRTIPILIIYPIVLKCFKDKTEDYQDEIIDEAKQDLWDSLKSNQVILGFGIGFPKIENEVKAKFRANQKKIEEMVKSSSEDDEDDDEEDILYD